MTLTVSSTCATILIESSLFNSTNTSNSITISINGGSLITLTPADNALNYTITPELLDLTSLTEGVYEINLYSTLFDSTTSEDKGCAAVICDLQCDPNILALYGDKANIKKILALEGLQAATKCVTCSCSLMTSYYNIIKENESTCSCGCCQSSV